MQVTHGGTFEFNNEEVTIPVDPFQDALDYDYTCVYIKNNPYQGGYYIFYAYSQQPFKFYSPSNLIVAKNILVIRRYTTYDDTFVNFHTSSAPDSTTWGLGLLNSNTSTLVYTNYDIVDTENDNVIYPSDAVSYPFFDEPTDLSNLSFDYVFITPRQLRVYW